MLPSLRGLFAYFSGWLSNRGIQLRSGTRQEFRFPSFSKVLTIRHGGTFSFRYKIGH